MLLKKISLQNYRGIQNLNVEFKPGINLIIGNNGAGKTSLLNGISVVLSAATTLLNSMMLQINANDIHMSYNDTGDATTSIRYHTPVELNAEISYNGKNYIQGIKRVSESANSDVDNLDLGIEIKRLSAEPKQMLPLLNYQNAGRGTVKFKESKQISIKQGKVERSAGYKETFSNVINFDDIENWCFRMDMAEYQGKKEIKEYKYFKTLVINFIKQLHVQAKKPRLYYSSAWGSLVYVDNSEETPFYNLSAGFQSVLCVAMELAYRASILNPELNTDDVDMDVDGIVLIDEIEMHLHPAWQWKILDALKNTFPKVQFIIATHSPIVLSSAKDASLFLMKNVNEVVSLENAFGYKIDDVLSLRQGTNDMPEEISAYYDKIEELLDSYDERGLNKLQETVREKYGKDSHISKMINDFIAVNKWIEEE